MSTERTTSPDALRLILDAVRTRLKKKQFETWFARTTLRALGPDEIVLGVPNPFLAEWMTREYRSVVEAAIRGLFGPSTTVRFEVDAPPAGPRTPASPGAAGAGTSDAAKPAALFPAAPPAAATADGASRPTSSGPGLAYPGVASAPAAAPAARVVVPGFGDAPTVVLQPHYTFDQFVVGPSNQLPHAVSRAVADRPGAENNPLFLYGAVGLGKTHLLQAICHQVLRRRPGCRIAYLSCEQFTNEYVSAVQRNATEAFRGRFRNVDMLVIDDIHFLANKERTQEEFFHTFNALYQHRKQIILSSDAAPTEIPTLEERLVSRFKWGIVAPIEPPEVETRMAIVRRKAEQLGLAVPDDVVALVAQSARSNIRELEGALASLRTRAAFDGAPIDLALAQQALAPLLRQEDAPVGLEKIATVVAGQYGVKLSDLRSLKRTQSISLPRQVAMFLARELTSHSLVEIGEFFGGRDHTTVLYAVERTDERHAADAAFRGTVDRIRDRLRAR